MSKTSCPQMASPLLSSFSKIFSRVFGPNIEEDTFQQYDPFKSPPDFNQAIQHGLAKRVCQCISYLKLYCIEEFLRIDSSLSLNTISSTSQVVKLICPCCNLPIENQQIPIDCENKAFAHLGGKTHILSKYLSVTFPLYFEYIKKCAILLTMQLIVSGIYDLITNLKGSTCEVRYSANFVCYPSFLNILSENERNQLKIQSILNFVMVIISIIMLEIFKVKQELQRYDIENHRITPADYTVEISGFPKNASIQDIESFLQLHLGKEVEICRLYFIFDMSRYCNLYRIRKQLFQKRNILLSKLRKIQFEIEPRIQNLPYEEMLEKNIYILEIERQINQINLHLEQNDSQLNSFTQLVKRYIYDDEEQSIQQQMNFSGRVLVVLNNHYDCRYLIRKWKFTTKEWFQLKMYKLGYSQEVDQIKRFIYKDKAIKLKKASEPSDYIWTNLGSEQIQNTIKRILINLGVITIFLISFGIIVLIKRSIKKQQKLYTSSVISISFSFVASTIVAGTNTLIGIFLRHFAGLETHKRQTSYYVSVGRRLSYLFFINMVCTTLFSNILALNSSISEVKGFPFNLEDLMSDFFFLFITNTYLSSIFNYFDIVYGYKLLKRYHHLKLGDLSHLSQQEANQLFEGHPVDMALRYANIQKVMFFTAAVSGFLPFGIPLSILGLLICYQVDKYLLLRRYTCSFYLDKRLANSMMGLLPLFAVFYSLGNLIIMCIPVLNDQTISTFQWPDLYQSAFFYIALSGFFISIVYRYLSKILIIQEWYLKILGLRLPRKSVQSKYYEQCEYFKEDYDNFHPPIKDYDEEHRRQKSIEPGMLKEIRKRLNCFD